MIKKSIIDMTDDEIKDFGKVCFTCNNCACSSYDESKSNTEFWCMCDDESDTILPNKVITHTCEKWTIYQ